MDLASDPKRDNRESGDVDPCFAKLEALGIMHPTKMHSVVGLAC